MIRVCLPRQKSRMTDVITCDATKATSVLMFLVLGSMAISVLRNGDLFSGILKTGKKETEGYIDVFNWKAKGNVILDDDFDNILLPQIGLLVCFICAIITLAAVVKSVVRTYGVHVTRTTQQSQQQSNDLRKLRQGGHLHGVDEMRFGGHLHGVDETKFNVSFKKRAVAKVKKGQSLSLIQRWRGVESFLKNSNLQISQQSRMQRLVEEMRSSLRKLGNVVTPDERLEEWACVIYESMSASSRTFHSVQHVFDISVDTDEIQKLAAFFHDCVYYTIDGGLSPSQNTILHGIIDEKDGDVYLTKARLEEDAQMVVDIFGFTSGQKLNPFVGLNEFLSAALAIRCFSEYLRPQYLAEIATCIEATIPFRAGEPMEKLYARLKKANETYTLQMADRTVEQAVQRAADFSNRDVLNFSYSNRGSFLSNTWNLLPESNICLRHTRVFRISGFSNALRKMSGFFENLDANTIFNNFRNKPSDKSIAILAEKAAENISIAVTYLNCKQLSISVVAAFAELTGGDAPAALFLGDLPEPDHISPSIEDLIIIGKKRRGVLLDDRILALLRDGRERVSDFDIRHSPCAALLYAEIGDAGLKESLKHVAHPMDKEHARKLLLSLPEHCVTTIGLACARIATTRRSLLKDIVEKIQNGETF